MRFRTPSSSRVPNHDHHQDEDVWNRQSRVRRQQSEPEGRPRARQPSRSAPQMERRGEPDGAASSGGQHKHYNGSHHQKGCPQKPFRRDNGWPEDRHVPGEATCPQPQPRARQRHRSHVRQRESSSGRQREPSVGRKSEVNNVGPKETSSGGRQRETRRRERSHDGARAGAMTCPICDGKFAT